MHLNEPYLLIEREWLDREQTRFTPIVTDLWRRAQPVVRYRLNDVLQVKQGALSLRSSGACIGCHRRPVG